MSADNVKLVQSLYDAFGRGEIATIAAAMAPDATWEVIGRASDFPTFGTRKGPAGVQSFFQDVGQHLDFMNSRRRSSTPTGTRYSCSAIMP